MAMQGRYSCIPVFSGFPGGTLDISCVSQSCLRWKALCSFKRHATMNKVKRWRKILDINFGPLQECTCKHTHSKKTPITHRHKQKKLLYLIFNADMDSRTIRLSGFPGSPHCMDEFTWMTVSFGSSSESDWGECRVTHVFLFPSWVLYCSVPYL